MTDHTKSYWFCAEWFAPHPVDGKTFLFFKKFDNGEGQRTVEEIASEIAATNNVRVSIYLMSPNDRGWWTKDLVNILNGIA